jgi:hypothetical protein
MTIETDNKSFEKEGSSNIGNDHNKSKFCSERNYEQTEFGESLL